MALHSFDPEVAREVGMNAAVLYQNIHYWCEHNAANERNFHDGRYWTYNSNKAFAELFPYMSAKQIRTALNKLVETGYIVKGSFNRSKFDQTRWYSDLHLPSGANRVPHLPSGANPADPEGKPIPVSKHIDKSSPVPNDVIETESDKTSLGTDNNNCARAESDSARTSKERFDEMVEQAANYKLMNCSQSDVDKVLEAVVPSFAYTRKRQDLSAQKMLCRQKVDELYGYAKELPKGYDGDLVFDAIRGFAVGIRIDDKILSYWFEDGKEPFKAAMKRLSESGGEMGWSKW